MVHWTADMFFTSRGTGKGPFFRVSLERVVLRGKAENYHGKAFKEVQ